MLNGYCYTIRSLATSTMTLVSNPTPIRVQRSLSIYFNELLDQDPIEGLHKPKVVFWISVPVL